MPTIELQTRIDAPVERVFNLARSIDAHTASTGGTGEVAVAGRTSGLIELGESVTWEATHLGVRQRLESRIVAMEFPNNFEDEMVRGAFARMHHRHEFEATEDGGTLMRDTFNFRSPLGPLGWLADRVFLTGYLRRFLEARNATLKAMAEREG